MANSSSIDNNTHRMDKTLSKGPNSRAFLEKYAQPNKTPANDAPVPPIMGEPYDEGHKAGDEDGGYGDEYDEGKGEPDGSGVGVDAAVRDNQDEGYGEGTGNGYFEGERDDGYTEGEGNGYEDGPGLIDHMGEDTGNRLGMQVAESQGEFLFFALQSC